MNLSVVKGFKYRIYCNRELKKEYLWFKDVDKFVLTNSIYNLDSVYQKFFKEHTKGKILFATVTHTIIQACICKSCLEKHHK